MTALTPDELAEIRGRDRQWTAESRTQACRDRQRLLSHIGYLTAEVERLTAASARTETLARNWHKVGVEADDRRLRVGMAVIIRGLRSAS